MSRFRKTDFRKKKFVIEIFFFDLYTPSFIVELHLHYLIHYWKRYVNHYTTGVISGHTCNF